MHSLTTHVRLALRTLSRRPGLCAGRILTLVLVVSAVSAVFTVANVTFLRPLPFPDPARLVRVYMQPRETTDFGDANPLYPVVFLHFRDHARAFAQFEGIWAADRAVSGDGEPDSVPAGRVSAGFFDLLGGTSAIGRTFTEVEVEAGAKVVVLSHGLWLRRFGADPGVVGRSLTLDREPFTIIGVMTPSFQPGFAPSELWTPLDIRKGAERLTLTSVQTIGRLAPGVSASQAVAELRGLEPDVVALAPNMLKGLTPGVVDLRWAQYGSQRPAVLLLLAAALALAAIAVANLANLTLADVMFRRSEFAVRAALGGSRLDLAAPEIVQSLIVAAAGGAGGVLAASWLMPVVLSLDPASALSAAVAPTDWRVVLGGLSVAVAVMLAAVAVPVLQLAGPALASDLTAGSRRAIGSGAARRARTALVVAQTALALVLLSSGALVVSTFERAARTDPGFDPASVVTAQLRLSANVLPSDTDRATFVDQVLERLRSTPGVIAAGTTLNRFQPNNAFQTAVQIEDHPEPDDQGHTAQYRRVSPGYFDTMRLLLVAGRDFNRQDWVGHQPVAIVSRSFARRYWPGVDPLGRRIRRGATSQAWSVVVGVVGDVRDVAIDQAPRETVYSPFYQASNPAAPVALVVRTAGDPRALVAEIKKAVWAIDPTQPLANVVTVQEFLDATLGPQRLRALLVTVCGVLGLLLATIGTYGVTSRSVVERRREVGIRLALGGTRPGVWWAIARGSVSGVLAGSAAGFVLSALACATLVALLPELGAARWAFTAAAAGILVFVGAGAAMAAAHAAVSVDPLTALRNE